MGISPTVTLSGAALGDGVGDQVLLNGVPLSVPPSSWSDTSIQFPWASAQSNGKKFTAGQQVSVGLIVNGQACSSLPVLVQGTPLGSAIKNPAMVIYASGMDKSAKVGAGISENSGDKS